jgi:multidrug resistance efflux pump
MEQVLAIAAHLAEHHVSRAEADLSEIEASLKKADSSLASLRAVALRAGLELPDKPHVAQVGRGFRERLELAEEMRISVRRIDQHRAAMTKDVHYHKDGARILFHVPEAVDFILARLASTSREADIEQIADEEVIRRRTTRKRSNSSEGGEK